MTPYATPEGTKRYVEKFAGKAAVGHFREQGIVGGVWISSIGVGTYLGEPDARTDSAYTEAIAAAARGGINVIDSAINYRFQRSERSIGAALKQLAAEGFQREELVLCTKGGYLTPDSDAPAGDPREYFQREYFDNGVCKPEEIAAGCHCMTPRYLEDQLGRSLKNLGVDCVDVYYLHNPETQLSDVPRDEFHRRLRAAFEFLESAVATGKIRFYGMATWNAFRQPQNGADYVSLEECVTLAREVAGDGHHFRVVQLPYNMGMAEALGAPNQPSNGSAVPMVKAANDLGVALVASASLFQGRLRNLPPFVGEVLGQGSDLLNALQFARSSPGITTALVGMSRVAHVAENLKLVGVPPTEKEQFLKLFEKKE